MLRAHGSRNRSDPHLSAITSNPLIPREIGGFCFFVPLICRHGPDSADLLRSLPWSCEVMGQYTWKSGRGRGCRSLGESICQGLLALGWGSSACWRPCTRCRYRPGCGRCWSSMASSGRTWPSWCPVCRRRRSRRSGAICWWIRCSAGSGRGPCSSIRCLPSPCWR
ncbi:hypothetical protein D3C81_1393030 [compost metagenome]